MGFRSGEGIKAVKVSFLLLAEDPEKKGQRKAQIFSIQFLIFFDSVLGKTLEPMGPKFS